MLTQADALVKAQINVRIAGNVPEPYHTVDH
jgi:hypothetical protein